MCKIFKNSSISLCVPLISMTYAKNSPVCLNETSNSPVQIRPSKKSAEKNLNGGADEQSSINTIIENNCKINDNYFLMFLNVQSLRSKVYELSVLLSSLGYPSIVLLCEHWLNSEETVFTLDYTLIDKYSRSEFKHGGTMILIYNSFPECNNFIKVNKYEHLLEEKSFEFSMTYFSNLSLYIICLYRAPSGNLSNFLHKIELLLSQLSFKANIILCGDLNINNFDLLDVNRLLFDNLLNTFNLRMFVKEPTRLTQHSASLLDYMCSNFPESDVECSVVNAGISDHEAVLCTFKTKNKNIYRKKRK